MAKYLKVHEKISVSGNFIAQLWRENDLHPHRQRTFKLSNDPLFAEKVVDVVGLYLNPPDYAVVFSVDEKTQIQALERSQPLLPMSFGSSECRTSDYLRHGVTNLFAALDVGTGQVHGMCKNSKNSETFLEFMNFLVKGYDKKQEIHVVLDNYSTHKTSEVKKWLEKHPNVTFHFTPTGSSWLNQVEIWFNKITKQCIRRGSDSSVKQLIKRITSYIKHHNTDPRPFTWSVTAKEILDQVREIQTRYDTLLNNNNLKKL
jgi:transposase